jgi:RNA-directed DNA polymerase
VEDEGIAAMLTTPESIRTLQRKLYRKAKQEPACRFHALYDKVHRADILGHAYDLVRANKGSAGIDGVSFEDIEAKEGAAVFVAELAEALRSKRYKPDPVKRVMIPKQDDSKRPLGIPTIRDRVAQMAVKLVIEPIFEADFCDNSYGFRPRRSAHDAIDDVAHTLHQGYGEVIDADISKYFDMVRHDLLLKKVAERIDDDQVMHLLKLMLKASGKRGVPQGGVISPLLSNIYLNEVDKMLVRAKEVTRQGRYTYIEYARFADDVVILIDGYRKWDWLARAAYKRLLEELTKLDVQLNTEKTLIVDLTRDEGFSFLGFDLYRRKTRQDKWGVHFTPRIKARSALLSKLKEVFRRFVSQPVGRVIELINPILRGWVNYFRVGHSSRCFAYVKDWVEKKIRRHLMRARKRKGFGWNRWSRGWIYQSLGLYSDYGVRYFRP